MPVPAAAAALGLTLEQIAAGAATLGAVAGATDVSASVGGTGWQFKGPSDFVSYPKELGQPFFAGPQHDLHGTLIRFHANGTVWDNECLVYFDGTFSHSDEAPMCYQDADGNRPYGTVPANRFLEAKFWQGGEELSYGFLSCGLSVKRSLAGDAQNPELSMLAFGHFDPVGSGDAEFSFALSLSTHGIVTLQGVHHTTDGLTITQKSDHIEVYLDQ